MSLSTKELLEFIIKKYSIAFSHDLIEPPRLLCGVGLCPRDCIIKPNDDMVVFALLRA